MEKKYQKHSQELANQLWSIANDLRGNMDSSKFKNYILGVIFYRYLSEKTESYMDELLKDDGLKYKEAIVDERYSETVKGWSIEHLGYIIYPKYLWGNLIDEIAENSFSIEHFERAISSLVETTIGQESEAAFDKLFDDMNLQDKDLGKEVSDRSNLISKVMTKVDEISFKIDDAEMDVLGTAYMMLISLFASDAGKKGGEFFTPTCASKLVSKLATLGLTEIKNAADSCAGSGSLLLEVQNQISTKNVGHFYAIEKNGSNYNLLRMNLLMHSVPYKKFSCFNSDSIKDDNYYENGEPILFDVQVENPPYSAKYNQSSKLLDDPRFSSCGVLCPQGKADLMFVESMTYHMADDGRIACLLPSGALFRGKKGKNGGKDDAEYIIRKHLIDDLNIVNAIIGLPPKMFHGTKLPVIVLVLKKKRNGNSDNIIFIDASKYFTPIKATNIITDEDIDRIIDVYSNHKTIDKFSYVASLEEVKENDYNCNIPRYVKTFEKSGKIDINKELANLANLDSELKKVESEIDEYLKDLNLEDKNHD
jgi:type I restriction enzyme M protein